MSTLIICIYAANDEMKQHYKIWIFPNLDVARNICDRNKIGLNKFHFIYNRI